MHLDRQRLYTGWFIGMLLLAGVTSMLGWIPHLFFVTFFSCVTFLIYTGLLLLWIRTLYARLLPSKSRTYIIMAAALMVFFLLLRIYKYRIAQAPLLMRYLVYAYYIPIALVPALFLAVCIRIRYGKTGTVIAGKDSSAGREGEHLVLLPALILSALFLTNDLHHLVYIPDVPISSFTVESGTYHYGPFFYLMYGWIVVAMGAGIMLLIRMAKSFSLRRLAAPLSLFLLWAVLLLLNNQFNIHVLPFPYRMPEIHIFCMLGVFEACIRNRLIPHNENYAGFFAGLTLPAMITDRHFHPVCRTTVPFSGKEHQLRDSLSAPVSLDPDTRLSGMALHGGYVFYTEDQSRLRRLHEELLQVNETLSLENDIIRREQELIRERERIRERTHLYEKASEEVYPIQKRISFLLSQAKPGTPEYRDVIARILVLMTYVKRKANFCILQAQQDTISLQELGQAMKETAFYLGYCGMSASVAVNGNADCPLQEAVQIYDCCEAILERLYGQTTELFVRLSKDGMLVMSDTASPISLFGLPLAAEQTFADGQLTLRVWKGGGRS